MSGTPAMGAALLAAAGRREAEPLDTISCSLRQHPTPSGTGGGWDVWARCARPIRSLSAAATAAADWPQQRNHIESNRQVAR
jgi:poly(3-hydroxybutyrate) depolymerase